MAREHFVLLGNYRGPLDAQYKTDLLRVCTQIRIRFRVSLIQSRIGNASYTPDQACTVAIHFLNYRVRILC
jgi:hypothetical protein